MTQAKVALITGGASGMGLATSKLLASQGWKVSILDMNIEAGEQRAKEIGGIFCKADVTNYESLSQAFLKTWKEYGRLDFVFANAGTAGKSNWYERQPEDENGLPPPPDVLVNKVNYDGVILTVYLAQHFLRKNSTPGGSIVVLASSGGLYPSPRGALYSGSKAGVIAFVRSIAVGLAPENIHVTSVCPGSVATSLMTPEQFSRMHQASFTTPERIAEIVVMLLKQEEEYRGAAVEVVAGKHYLRWRQDYCTEDMAKCWEEGLGGSTPFRDGGVTIPKNP